MVVITTPSFVLDTRAVRKNACWRINYDYYCLDELLILDSSFTQDIFSSTEVQKELILSHFRNKVSNSISGEGADISVSGTYLQATLPIYNLFFFLLPEDMDTF